MKKTKPLTLTIALLFSTFASTAFATSNDELLKQIEALTQRIKVLEERLNIVVKNPESITSLAAQPIGPWQQVGIGMKYHEIEELLGKPTRKQKGDIALWFYSDKRKDGPFVKFVFKQVQSWRGPAANK